MKVLKRYNLIYKIRKYGVGGWGGRWLYGMTILKGCVVL